MQHIVPSPALRVRARVGVPGRAAAGGGWSVIHDSIRTFTSSTPTLPRGAGEGAGA